MKQGQKNIVFLCDKKGIITGIINDEIRINAEDCIGKKFTYLLRKEEQKKASDFIEKIGIEKVVLDYEMFIKTSGREDMFVFTGINLGYKILIIATDSYNNFNNIFEEMSKVSNELTNIVRKYASQKERIVRAERGRIARDLHDSVTQTLFATRMIAEILPGLWEKDKIEAKKQLNKLKYLTKESLTEIRRLLMEIMPKSFSEESLGDLLSQVINSSKIRSNIDMKLDVEENEEKIKPGRDVKEAIYRISQEAINNAIKHSGAKKIKILLRHNNGNIYLKIEDDGCGFHIDKNYKQKFGIYIMNERARAIESELDITSKKGEGTIVTLSYGDKKKKKGKYK